MELTSNTDTHWRSEELFFCLELRSTTDTHWPSEELFFWLWNDLNFGNLLLAVPLNVLPNNKEYRYYGMVLCSMVWYFIDHCVAEWLMWPSDCFPLLCGQMTDVAQCTLQQAKTTFPLGRSFWELLPAELPDWDWLKLAQKPGESGGRKGNPG